MSARTRSQDNEDDRRAAQARDISGDLDAIPPNRIGEDRGGAGMSPDDAEVIFHPGSEPMFAGDAPGYPCIEIGGVQVYVYVKEGELRVAVHFDGDPEVWGEDKCIPIKIDLTGGDPYLYEADAEGNEWINGVPA